jgi:hypothetical protein
VRVPSQVPPQDEPSLAQASRSPCGAPFTATQVPTEPAASQASHCPPQAWLQQTPSVQLPLPHCPAEPQAWPLVSLGTHCPDALQKSEPTQSLALPQLVRQAAVPQIKGAQA